MDAERLEILEETIEQIEKKFGTGAIMKFGDKGLFKGISVVPTGSLGLDIALGVGGIPRGRIVEIYGPESSGKTTLTLHIIAEAQKLGGTCVFVDAEHALDPVYAKKVGVNVDDLYISQPDDGEQALDIVETMIRSGAIELVVVDSVAALVPRAEIEGEMGASHMGLQARLMSQALRKITAIANKSNTIVIFTNQLREKIGYTFGNPETTTGGRALKFYASLRLDIRRRDGIKSGTEFVASKTTVRVVKNKVSPPFKVAEFDIVFGEGISKEGDVLDHAVEIKVATKAGAWYSYGEVRLGQGRENAKIFLRENPDIYDELDKKVRIHYKLIPDDEALETAEEIETEKKETTSPPKKDNKSKKEKNTAKEATESEVETLEDGSPEEFMDTEAETLDI